MRMRRWDLAGRVPANHINDLVSVQFLFESEGLAGFGDGREVVGVSAVEGAGGRRC